MKESVRSRHWNRKDKCIAYKKGLEMGGGDNYWDVAFLTEGNLWDNRETPLPKISLNFQEDVPSPVPSHRFTGLHLERHHPLLPSSQHTLIFQQVHSNPQFLFQVKLEKVTENSFKEDSICFNPFSALSIKLPLSSATVTRQSQNCLAYSTEEGGCAIVTTDSVDMRIRPTRNSSFLT